MGFKMRLPGNMKTSSVMKEILITVVQNFFSINSLTEVLFGKTALLSKLKKFGVFRPVHNCGPCQLKLLCRSVHI